MTTKSITVKDFQGMLEEGHYAGIGGARKAISRRKDWSDGLKKKARGIAEAHFGIEEGDAPPKKAKSVERRASAAPATDAPKKRRKRRTKAEMEAARAGTTEACTVEIGTVAHTAVGTSSDNTTKINDVNSAVAGYKETLALGAPVEEVARCAQAAMRKLELLVADIVTSSQAVGGLPATAEDEEAIEAFSKAATAALATGKGSNGVIEKPTTLAPPIV